MIKLKSAHMDSYIGGCSGNNSAVISLEIDYTSEAPVRPPEIAGLKHVVQYKRPQSHKEATLKINSEEKIMGCGEEQFGQLQGPSQSWEAWRGIEFEDLHPVITTSPDAYARTAEAFDTQSRALRLGRFANYATLYNSAATGSVC